MEWKISDRPVGYEDALVEMERRVADIRAGAAEECVWLLEHPPLYTAGTSARDEDLLAGDLPVFKTGRGGQYTYHGPGQRVAYVMVDLKKRQQSPDIKQFVWGLEEWIIRALAEFGVRGERRAGRIGVWVATADGDKKIAAAGVRIRHWVSFHGVSVNVKPDLSHYAGIVPCGISEYGVTSLAELGVDISLDEFDKSLKSNWNDVFYCHNDINLIKMAAQ